MSAVPRPTDFELIQKAFNRQRVSYQELSGRSCSRKVAGWRPCCMTANYTLDGEAICSSHAAQQARKELAEKSTAKLTPAEMLREFHTAFGLQMRDEPGLADVPEDLLHLRGDLLLEEAQEYLTAERAGDRIGVADALGDVTYVAYGNALTYGIDLDAAVAETVGNGGVKLVRLARRYADAAARRDLAGIASVLADVVIGTAILAALHGIDLLAVLAEVHRSNMSKLGPDGRPILRDDGKVLKGPGYHRPDIAGVLGMVTT